MQGSLGSCGREADSYKKSLRFQKYTDSGVWTGPSTRIIFIILHSFSQFSKAIDVISYL